MIPKVEACLTALRHAATAQIVDGRQSGALMAALESEAGTVISRNAEA
jgi:acetylglutamate kinase